METSHWFPPWFSISFSWRGNLDIVYPFMTLNRHLKGVKPISKGVFWLFPFWDFVVVIVFGQFHIKHHHTIILNIQFVNIHNSIITIYISLPTPCHSTEPKGKKCQFLSAFMNNTNGISTDTVQYGAEFCTFAVHNKHTFSMTQIPSVRYKNWKCSHFMSKNSLKHQYI